LQTLRAWHESRSGQGEAHHVDIDFSLRFREDCITENGCAVFARIASLWGRLDIMVHSIAWAPNEDLQGGLLD